MRRKLTALMVLVTALALAAPVAAITTGKPDDGEHPYVGELLFFVPDAVDPRFDAPGSWFGCTGTLLSATVIVTAGHCVFGVGLSGDSTTHDGSDTTAAQGGTDGNDIWISLDEIPDFSILKKSSTYGRDQNNQRYVDWSAALTASSAWHRGTAHPHPDYDDNAFLLHDAGIIVLDGAVTGISTYGKAAGLNYLEQYRSTARNEQRFEVVGYGLEKVLPRIELGGDTRRKAEPKLDNMNGKPRDTYIILSNNGATGGTCFGDSGGPTFDNTNSNLVVAVTSFGKGPNCTGIGGAYRLDQPDDLDFLKTYGIVPAP